MTCDTCGNSTTDAAQHRRLHRDAELGVSVAESGPGRVVRRVGVHDSKPLQRAAMALHRCWARTTGNSANAIHHPLPGSAKYPEDFDDGGVCSWVLIEAGRAIASITVAPTTSCEWQHVDGTITDGEDAEGWAISSLFVARAHRREGAARQLVETFADAVGVPVRDLFWEPPLTDAGAAFAHSLVDGEPIRLAW